MNLLHAKKVHLIGIKGVGMTMLAEYLVKHGITISGSDTKEKFMTDAVLQKNGIKVIEEFAPANIPTDAGYIIYSTAYNPDNNQELRSALTGRSQVITYAEAIGQIFNHKYGIAVVGSHGKTTTTAWLGYVLDKCGLSPSVLVGAAVPQFDGAGLVGVSDYLVIEADEYQNKLQHFQPKMVLLNNIDYDHPDFFPTTSDYTKVFIDFIAKLPRAGFLIANWDDPIIRRIAGVNTRAQIVSYAINEAGNYVAYDIKIADHRQYFKVKMAPDQDENDSSLSDLGDFAIDLPGRHNIYNALAVIAAAIELRVPLHRLREHLADFRGTARRLEKMGEWRGITIIDDYAHHPTEIKASLDALRQLYPQNRLVVLFHPHTFTRTKALLKEFSLSFSLADELIVIDIYGSAREKQGGVSSRDLVKLITSQPETAPQQATHYLSTQTEAENWIRQNTRQGDVVVLMGAGDIFRIGLNLLGVNQ